MVDQRLDAPPTDNGSEAPAKSAATAGAEVIAALRSRPRNVLLFRGFGTLVAGAVLYVLMLLLAPSVAPEHIVQRPVSGPTTSSVPTATPTTVVSPSTPP